MHSRLVDFIEAGTLEDEVANAYASLNAQNALLDAFEAKLPHVAERLPWFEARQGWKRAGRPRPPWYEVLYLCDVPRPFKKDEHLLAWPYPPREAERHRRKSLRNTQAWQARQAAKKKAHEEPSDSVQ